MHPVAKNYVATVGGSSVKTEASPHLLGNTPTATMGCSGVEGKGRKALQGTGSKCMVNVCNHGMHMIKSAVRPERKMIISVTSNARSNSVSCLREGRAMNLQSLPMLPAATATLQLQLRQMHAENHCLAAYLLGAASVQLSCRLQRLADPMLQVIRRFSMQRMRSTC